MRINPVFAHFLCRLVLNLHTCSSFLQIQPLFLRFFKFPGATLPYFYPNCKKSSSNMTFGLRHYQESISDTGLTYSN
jgi:hypothetical protein